MVTLTENFERRLQVRVMLMILLLILRLFVMLMQEAGKRSKELKGKIADLKVRDVAKKKNGKMWEF